MGHKAAISTTSTHHIEMYLPDLISRCCPLFQFTSFLASNPIFTLLPLCTTSAIVVAVIAAGTEAFRCTTRHADFPPDIAIMAGTPWGELLARGQGRILWFV